MVATELTDTELLETGVKALRDSLGTIGTIRFLRQFPGGMQDYTTERRRWLDDLSLDEILASIREREKTT